MPRLTLLLVPLLLAVFTLSARDVHRGMVAERETDSPPPDHATSKAEAATDWADCLSCHPSPERDLPRLAELRPAGLGASLPACDGCHEPLELVSSRSNWSHPVRSVATHLDCAACHAVVPHGADNPPPRPSPAYDAEACFTCHPGVGLALGSMFSHHLGSLVRCHDCHPAHQPLAAALPARLVPSNVRDYWLGHCDWWLSNQLCLECHSISTLFFELGEGFVTLNTVSYHELHVARGDVLCVECHEPHGGPRQAMVREQLLDGRSLSYFDTFDGGTCSVICHDVDHQAWQYINEAH